MSYPQLFLKASILPCCSKYLILRGEIGKDKHYKKIVITELYFL